MEEIKKIVAGYLKTAPVNIRGNTAVDKTALKNSIVVHRMYGALSQAGFVVKDYMTVKTYDQLLSKIGAEELSGGILPAPNASADIAERPSIGIDIESVSALPPSDDYRSPGFYKDNFTDQEISYCLMQPVPVSSFAGLFAAKEAIVKADNRFRDIAFNKIALDHDAAGKPFISDFDISISHVEGLAIAVATSSNYQSREAIAAGEELQKTLSGMQLRLKETERKVTRYLLVSVISFLALIVMIILLLVR